MIRSLLIFALLLAGAGCIQPTGGVVPIGPKPVPAATGSIEKLTYEASQQRDAIGAKLLLEAADEIKAKDDRGEPIHDKWLMDKITEANTKSAVAAGEKLAEELGKRLNGGDRLNPANAEKVFRGMAAGKLRASK